MTPKRTRGSAVIAIVLIVILLLAAAPVGARGPHSIKVMTRNEYIGADLSVLLGVATPEEFLAAAQAILTQVAANNFPRRALGLAREVFLTRPDVIGLQEVFDLSLNGQHPGPPFVDHLQVTLQALAALGLQYVVAAIVPHQDVTVPIDVNGDTITDLVRVLDRDVILVKAGIPFTKLVGNVGAGGLCGVPIPNPLQPPPPPLPAVFVSQVSQDGCTYSVIGVVPSPPPLPTLVVKRGFVGIDVRVEGKNYRIVNTHLEVETPSPIVQSLQAVELAGTLAATTPAGRTLILLGDFNSSPEDTAAFPPPYQVLAGAGFDDVWERNLLAFADPDGFTCCQNADLANPTSLLSERIDLIWIGEGTSFRALALVTGRVPLFSSTPPRWASDHGGVFGTLIFPH